MGADALEQPANGAPAGPPVREGDGLVVGVTRLHRNIANGIAPDVSARARPIAEPEEWLRFERLVSDFSARFINLPADDLDTSWPTTPRSFWTRSANCRPRCR